MPERKYKIKIATIAGMNNPFYSLELGKESSWMCKMIGKKECISGASGFKCSGCPYAKTDAESVSRLISGLGGKAVISSGDMFNNRVTFEYPDGEKRKTGYINWYDGKIYLRDTTKFQNIPILF